MLMNHLNNPQMTWVVYGINDLRDDYYNAPWDLYDYANRDQEDVLDFGYVLYEADYKAANKFKKPLFPADNAYITFNTKDGYTTSVFQYKKSSTRFKGMKALCDKSRDFFNRIGVYE